MVPLPNSAVPTATSGGDGHHAVLSWAEIDGDFGNAPVPLATRMDDADLDTAGAQLVVPSDRCGARCVSAVTGIWIGAHRLPGTPQSKDRDRRTVPLIPSSNPLAFTMETRTTLLQMSTKAPYRVAYAVPHPRPGRETDRVATHRDESGRRVIGRGLEVGMRATARVKSTGVHIERT